VKDTTADCYCVLQMSCCGVNGYKDYIEFASSKAQPDQVGTYNSADVPLNNKLVGTQLCVVYKVASHCDDLSGKVSAHFFVMF